jgi:DNA mismatch endonuclease, patch repair protein
VTDRLTREQRSSLMSRIRGKDTSPERALRAALRKARVEFRSYRRISGVRVDIALPKPRVAIFVHGCFWHGCRQHYTAPLNNAAFWRAKLAENRTRDRRQERAVRAAGWTPVVVWEHALRADPERALGMVLAHATRARQRASR